MTEALLLAAGRSERFGRCKLQTPFRGKPLVRHAAEAILAAGFTPLAVTSDPAVAALLPEFRIIPASGLQSETLGAGLRAVTGDRVLVVLGDMPNVTADMLRQVAALPLPSATTDSHRTTPPACLPRRIFPDVQALKGDRGAGALLRDLPPCHLLQVPVSSLNDIDTPADLQSSSEAI